MTSQPHPLDKRNEPAPEPHIDAPSKGRNKLERVLDKEIEDTFPASDPPSTTQPTSTEPAGDPTVKP